MTASPKFDAAAVCWSIAKQIPAIEPGQEWSGVMSNHRVKVLRLYRLDDFPYWDQVQIERPDGSRDVVGAAAFIGARLLLQL